MFYASSGEPSSIRLLVWGEWYEEQKQRFDEWIRRFNESGAEIRLNNPVQKWGYWRELLVAMPNQDNEVSGVIFDREVADEVAEIVGQWVDILRPYVEDVLTSQAGAC